MLSLTPISSGVRYWRGSAVSKGQPQEIDEYRSHEINVYRLKAIPDFASGRFKMMEHLDPSARVGFVVSWQKNLLKSLAYFSYLQSADIQQQDISCGYSLRIIYQPSREISGTSTEIYLLARVASNDPSLTARVQRQQADYFNSSLRSPLYQFEYIESDRDLPWLKNQDAVSCYEIIKSEEVFQWLEADKKYFYSPGNFSVNKGNNMMALFEQIQGYRHQVCIDLTLVPTQLEAYEKKVVSRYLEALSEAGRGIREEEVDPDSNTQKAKTVYEEIKKKYYSGIIFLSSFRVFSPSRETCQNVASQLAASCTANTVSPRIIEVNDTRYAVQTALQVNINEEIAVSGIWNVRGNRPDGFPGGPETMKRFHRIVDLDEASAFFRLPVPINQPCPGVRYDSGSAFVAEKSKGQTINIGHYYRNVKTNEICDFDIEQLKTHLLVVGGSGSGKTTTTFNLLTQLWGKHGIPFMVFDPKVTPEYRYLKRLPEFEKDLLIFTPGQEFITPLRMNPFDVIPGIPVQEHISRIFDCFMGALPLENPLPAFIQEAIDYLYEKKRWQLAYSQGGDLDKNGQSLEVPTMPEFYDKVLDLAQKNYGSDKEVGDRIKGALKARLYRLVANSGIGSMFQASRPLPLADLMSKPVIFELGGLNKQEQSLFSLFILVFVFEYVRAVRVGQFQPQREGERATDLDLRHVLLVEEAHNLLGQMSASGSGEEGNSKNEVIDKFAQIMREMRAGGEGVIVVDQSPAALAQSIVDATNLKLMHRLPSPGDREYLGSAMCLTEGEAQLSGIFSPGECFYYVPGWDAAKRVATDNFKAKPGVQEKLARPFKDEEVIQAMDDFMQQDRASLISGLKAIVNQLSANISGLKEILNSSQVEAVKEGYKAQIKQKQKLRDSFEKQLDILSQTQRKQ